VHRLCVWLEKRREDSHEYGYEFGSDHHHHPHYYDCHLNCCYLGDWDGNSVYLNSGVKTPACGGVKAKSALCICNWLNALEEVAVVVEEDCSLLLVPVV
jgi:hypothetical protein